MTSTNLTTKGGAKVLICDTKCTACGCYEVFKFDCNCGMVHNDCCYNCGLFSGMKHEPVEEQAKQFGPKFAELVAKRCVTGQVEHIHDRF